MKGEKIEPIDPGRLRTFSIKDRRSKVKRDFLGRPLGPGATFRDFLDALPDILGAADLKAVIASLAEAHKGGKMVAAAMGAHVIKVGLSPVVIDLMQRGVIKAVAMNGAGIVHDAEMATVGATSEDVASEIDDGSFGMARETADFLNEAAVRGADRGLGRAVGERLLEAAPPHVDLSILAWAARLDLPATVHVALGTDIVHMHPTADGAAIGAATMRDFRLFTSVVARLQGGVYLNIGSAVVLPEVFLKALSMARNLGYPAKDFTAVNLDFMRHYRPMTNVLDRPTQSGGKAYGLVGHHEIILPLIAAGVVNAIAGRKPEEAPGNVPENEKG